LASSSWSFVECSWRARDCEKEADVQLLAIRSLVFLSAYL
jgi:hypothetical protein